MDEKIRFIQRLQEGESMSELCREYKISRKTGYKFWNRYRNFGLEALLDQRRRVQHHANQLPFQIEQSILNAKREKPHWGAAKIRERLIRKYPDVRTPAKSTIQCVLDRHDLVSRRKKKRERLQGTALSHAFEPNDLWCTDYKGEFLLGNQEYCYPLTITDQASRYLLACESLESTKEKFAFPVFERIFKEFGIPRAIRSDNGVPFSGPYALFGLSKLSVWWLRLGIEIERIKPGHPEQNSRHERMHLTLKQQTTKPPAENLLQQQVKFDDFQKEYNEERPHEALAMKTPAEIYKPSLKIYRGLPDVTYPFHDRTVLVTRCGRICFRKLKIHFSQVFAGQLVGIKEVNDGVWLVTFMNYDLGYFDEESHKFEPLKNPFGPKVLPPPPV